MRRVITDWSIACVSVGLMCLVGIGPVIAAGPYERPTDRRVSEVLPPELAAGPHHRVQDPVVADGYMLHFTVESNFGTFEVTGLGALRKLVREIYAIAELKKIKGTEAWGKQVKESATGSLQFVGKLMTHPMDTLSGLPRGIYKGVENVSTSVSNPTDPSQDSRTRTLLLQAGKKREYAAALGVDPYSSNSVLQKELNSVAWAAALGSWTVTVATMPIGGTAGAVVSATKMSDAVGDYLKTETPNDLRRRNEKRLTEMGLPNDLITRYLDHKIFTPRHDTILTEALARLANVPGRDAFVEAALLAEDEVDANFVVTMAQMMRGYHETVAPLTEIRQVAGLTLAQSRKGTALVVFPLDYGVWTERADRLTDEVKATYKAPGFNGNFDLWVMGRVSAQAKQQAAQKRIAVTEEINKRIEIID
jgi:hypothetical protein